ncbi:hypothetical protein [Gorillibacterium massiliense]|uniref:hypothetical protein n=1 Tax=Gorillibacterium massiliense TaxID=1280390 RepID=UPI0004AF4AC2|nr:hypothetical protein [Gorillibacterium massiliense]
MIKPGTILSASADLDNAMWFGLDVSVWQSGKLINHGGPIEAITELSVKICGQKYLRLISEFRVR